jgi:hypothetical protein
MTEPHFASTFRLFSSGDGCECSSKRVPPAPCSQKFYFSAGFAKVSRPKALIPISLGKDVFRQRSRSSRLSAKSIDPLPQGLRMLSLLIRNVMWAAWWPYSAWLLSLEKAAKRMSAEASRPPKGEETRRGQYHRRVGWLARIHEA